MAVNRGVDVDAHVGLLFAQLIFGLLHPQIKGDCTAVGIFGVIF